MCCLCIGLRTSCIRFLAQEVTSAFRQKAFWHYLSFLVQIILLRRCTNATNIQMYMKCLQKEKKKLRTANLFPATLAQRADLGFYETHTHTHMYIQMQIHLQVHTHTYTRLHTCTYIHTYA